MTAPRRTLPIRGVLGCLLVLYGCGAGDRTPPRARTSDWEVDGRATVTLGLGEEAPEKVFGRIVGVVILSDGRTVVADGMPSDVRWFGPDGALLARMGGIGDGPGEFRRIGSLQRLAGDSIAVFDAGSARLTKFDASAAFAGSVTLAGRSPAEAYQISDGRIISINPIAPTWGDPPRTGLRRVPVEISWHGSDGRVLGLEGTYPGADIYVAWSAEPSQRRLGIAPLGRWTRLVVGGSRYVVATGDPGPLQVVDVELGDTLTVLLPEEDLGVTGELAEAYAAGATASGSPSFPLPERRPAYSRILHDGEWLWVSEYVPDPVTPEKWTAHSLKTGLAKGLQVPQGLDIRDVFGGQVVGIRRSQLGVESVEVHPLRRDRHLNHYR
jgi:hypothetical protein